VVLSNRRNVTIAHPAHKKQTRGNRRDRRDRRDTATANNVDDLVNCLLTKASAALHQNPGAFELNGLLALWLFCI
jgi:hypothetical protein